MQRSALCRSRRELSNEYLLAKIGVDTAENEPCKVCPFSAYRSPRFDKGTLEVEQDSIRLNLESIRIDHPALVALIMKLVTPALTTAREIDERFSELHELLRSSIEKQYAKQAVHPPRHHAVSQSLPSAEVEAQSVLRPAPYPVLPTSAQQMDSLLSRLALASPGESADIIRL